ncbi:hypothetical protein [Ruthenibacterium lactatiformans]|uniref:DUF7768 domain-containing protein n=1 Tax=Ruthenibacterium lactatiformans TaxID=1550024 RepID=UPI003AB739A7
MEKAFAYICAAQDAAPRLLRRYCHKVYELGYVPICPRLSLPQYLSEDVPEEQRAMSQISQQLLRRCRMLVVCGGEITAAMACEIGTAEKLKLICTTLDGLAKIRENEHRTLAEQRRHRVRAATGLASIARGYPRAFWGRPQTPGIQI